MAIHPKCGKSFPNGERAGHCATCCETFIGLSSFEAHRVGAHGTPTRLCEIQPYDTKRTATGDIIYGHWQDDRGNWRYGKQLTKAESAQIMKQRLASIR